MVKLQLRLDEAQTALILEALNEMIIGGPYDDERDNADQLESWLRWRRDKVWGRPAGSHAPAGDPVAVTAIIEADGKDHGRTLVGNQIVTVQGKDTAKPKRT